MGGEKQSGELCVCPVFPATPKLLGIHSMWGVQGLRISTDQQGLGGSSGPRPCGFGSSAGRLRTGAGLPLEGQRAPPPTPCKLLPSVVCVPPTVGPAENIGLTTQHNE